MNKITYLGLIEKLSKAGCEFVADAGGVHQIWRNPRSGAYTVIPKRSGNMDSRTLEKIVNDLGLSLDGG